MFERVFRNAGFRYRDHADLVDVPVIQRANSNECRCSAKPMVLDFALHLGL